MRRSSLAITIRTVLQAGFVLGFAAWSEATAEGREITSFAVFGDSGYILSYEDLDEDEIFVTPEALIADEQKSWLEKHKDLSGFTPPPMVFEGSQGSYMVASGLYPVAWAMDRHCKVAGCDFAAMLGDNIYPDGATLGADDRSDRRRFTDMFDRPFGQLGAGTPGFTIYSMMGNHDWRISRKATMRQMKYLQEHPNFTMPGLYYKVSPPAAGGRLDIFVIDTEMLLASTTVYKDDLDAEGCEIETGELDEFPPHAAPRRKGEKRMVAWLERELAASKADWKIVLGHHAIWSGGGSKYEKARALRKLFLPALCRHADAYMAGDDHMLEVYTDSCEAVEGALPAPLPAIVSGAASKLRATHPAFMENQKRNNPELTHIWSKGTVWGFAHVRLYNDRLKLQMISTPPTGTGEPVIEHEVSFSRRTGAGS